MPNLAKLFERVVYNQLKLIVTPHLSKRQHGFLSSRCIESNLMEFTFQVHKSFENGTQTDAFYADVKKAFDSVNTDKLIRKIAKFPIGNSFLHWIRSYFANRKLFVSVGSAKSELFNVTSGVGQGTILGPLLFVMFFDDSDDDDDTDSAYSDCETNETYSYSFADDKKLSREIKTVADSAMLQKSIDRFVIWCDRNDLELNSSKCKIMTFSLKRKTIETDYYIRGI